MEDRRLLARLDQAIVLKGGLSASAAEHAMNMTQHREHRKTTVIQTASLNALREVNISTPSQLRCVNAPLP